MPSEGKSTLMNLDMAVRALTFQPGFGGVRGIVIGRLCPRPRGGPGADDGDDQKHCGTGRGARHCQL